MLPWHQYVMGVLYILAGINHFRSPKNYISIMPPYIPQHRLMVTISGVAEMVLGLMLLNPETQTLAAWGIIAMLIVFFTVHIYMIQEAERFKKIPKWILILRLPLQFVLIWWASIYI